MIDYSYIKNIILMHLPWVYQGCMTHSGYLRDDEIIIPMKCRVYLNKSI